ncbi:hypothetical protein SNEBB_003697 [Seison nebaliae]|nr:hypothetical protein SNEBB_003697 [Seison nebaliae]
MKNTQGSDSSPNDSNETKFLKVPCNTPEEFLSIKKRHKTPAIETITTPSKSIPSNRYFLERSMNEVLVGKPISNTELTPQSSTSSLSMLCDGKFKFSRFIFRRPMDQHDGLWRYFVYNHPIDEIDSVTRSEDSDDWSFISSSVSKVSSSRIHHSVLERPTKRIKRIRYESKTDLAEPMQVVWKKFVYGSRVGWRRFVYSDENEHLFTEEMLEERRKESKKINKILSRDELPENCCINIIPDYFDTTMDDEYDLKPYIKKVLDEFIPFRQIDMINKRQKVFGDYAYRQLQFLKYWHDQKKSSTKITSKTMSAYKMDERELKIAPSVLTRNRYFPPTSSNEEERDEYVEFEPWWYSRAKKCFCDESCEYCSQFLNLDLSDIEDVQVYEDIYKNKLSTASSIDVSAEYYENILPEYRVLTGQELNRWLDYARHYNMLIIQPVSQTQASETVRQFHEAKKFTTNRAAAEAINIDDLLKAHKGRFRMNEFSTYLVNINQWARDRLREKKSCRRLTRYFNYVKRIEQFERVLDKTVTNRDVLDEYFPNDPEIDAQLEEIRREKQNILLQDQKEAELRKNLIELKKPKKTRKINSDISPKNILPELRGRYSVKCPKTFEYGKKYDTFSPKMKF